MMTDKLKPCPFCGCTDIRLAVFIDSVQIWCSKCKATLVRSSHKRYESLAETKEHIKPRTVMAWNRRVEDDR